MIVFLCIVVAIVCFGSLFYFATQVGEERVVPPAPEYMRPRRNSGALSPKGLLLRRKIMLLSIVGVVLLIVALLFSMSPAA